MWDSRWAHAWLKIVWCHISNSIFNNTLRLQEIHYPFNTLLHTWKMGTKVTNKESNSSDGQMNRKTREQKHEEIMGKSYCYTEQTS